MPVPQMSVKEHQRGCTSKFYISVILNYKLDFKQSSDPYNICDMARIQFKLQRVSNESGTSVYAYVSTTKVESVKDSTIKVKITRESPQYSDRSIVGTDIEEWRSMGTGGFKMNIGDVFIYEIEVTISVSKITTTPLFAKIYEDVDEFIDFHLSAADGTVPVHKVLLAANSDMFRAMLNGDWKETKEGRIELKGVTRQTLQHLKDFMYLGTLPEGADELLKLLELAVRYLINNLRTACVEKLIEVVTSENLYAMLEVACANNVTELAVALFVTTPENVVTGFSRTIMNNENKQVPKTADEK